MSRGLVLTLLLLTSVSGIRLLALQFKFRALSQVHPSRPPQSSSPPPLWHIFPPSSSLASASIRLVYSAGTQASSVPGAV